MTFDDIVIGGLCLGLGYWLVSWIMEKLRNPSQQSDVFDADNNILIDESRGLESNWYRILGVSPIATTGEIQNAYRTLIAKYHPDKFATSEKEQQEMAEKKSRQINVAYTFAVNKVGHRFFNK